MALLVTWLALWLVAYSGNGDKTPRGLKLVSPALPGVSVGIGGLSEQDVAVAVADLAQRFNQTPVEVATPSRTLTVNAADLGLVVDVDATVAAIMDLNSDTDNPLRWAGSFFGGSRSELLLTLSADAGIIADLEAELYQPPQDPHIVLENGSFAVAPAVPGEDPNLAPALPGLLEAAKQGDIPLKVEANVRLIPSAVRADPMLEAVDWVNERTSQGILIAVDDVTKRVQPAQLRSWLTVQSEDSQWYYTINQEVVDDDLAALFVEVATVASEPVIAVEDGVPVMVSEAPALVCCDVNAAQVVRDALADSDPSVALSLRESDEISSQDWLIDRGIIELTGQFTTSYVPRQPRVTNIHRIAKMLQGVVVYPGETFSVNDFVGERTRENGFVEAGTIYYGVYSTDVGGGISQFITTLFTATFNAGMDFPEYQAHTIDIVRYRDGVDATISWPRPDFKFRNPHPYAVLLWPTVTDSSVTVSVYSTAHAEVEWTDRYETQRQFCTLRTTERSRTYADGTVLLDSVEALYQPREGINCQGQCTSVVLALDANGDGRADLGDDDLPRECVAPDQCTGARAPKDLDGDGRADLCGPAAPGSIPPPDTGLPETDLPDLELPGTELPGTELPGSGQTELEPTTRQPTG